MVCEPVQQSAGQPLRAEHLGPLVERQVGGHEDRSTLVALAEDLEEHPYHKDQFIYDEETDSYTCPHRQTLVPPRSSTAARSLARL